MAKTRKATVTRPNPDDISTSGMAPITVQCLLLGIDLGWTATEMRNGVIRLTREHEGRAVAINLPTNQRSIKEGVGQSWIRKVIRYADPLKRAMLQTAVEDYESPIAGDKERARVIMQGLRSHEVLLDHGVMNRLIQMEPEPEPLEVVAEPEPEPKPEQAEQEHPTAEPEIVKIKPWVARHSMRREGGEVYESKAVLERKWSDGSTDYACPRCEFTNVEALSVARHYGGKHGKDNPAAQNREEMYVDPTRTWVPTERQKGRIHRLASEMKLALEALGPEMTVDQCAEWIVKHRDDQREHMVDESTPLTPEQAIERIRRLVDGGAYADLMARIEAIETEAAATKAQADVDRQHERLGAQNAIRALEQRLEEQQAACAESDARVAAAEQDAREAHERWTALRDIVNG